MANPNENRAKADQGDGLKTFYVKDGVAVRRDGKKRKGPCEIRMPEGQGMSLVSRGLLLTEDQKLAEEQAKEAADKAKEAEAKQAAKGKA